MTDNHRNPDANLRSPPPAGPDATPPASVSHTPNDIGSVSPCHSQSFYLTPAMIRVREQDAGLTTTTTTPQIPPAAGPSTLANQPDLAPLIAGVGEWINEDLVLDPLDIDFDADLYEYAFHARFLNPVTCHEIKVH